MNHTSRYHREVAQFRRSLLLRALLSANGNRTRAAAALGLERTYLSRLLRVFAIRVPQRRTE